MPGPESVLVASIVTAVKAHWPDAWTFKVHGNPLQEAGVPDLLVCIDGRLIALEVKAARPGETAQHARGRTTMRQQVQLARINKAGGTADTVTSVEEALDAIVAATTTRTRE